MEELEGKLVHLFEKAAVTNPSRKSRDEWKAITNSIHSQCTTLWSDSREIANAEGRELQLTLNSISSEEEAREYRCKAFIYLRGKYDPYFIMIRRIQGIMIVKTEVLGTDDYDEDSAERFLGEISRIFRPRFASVREPWGVSVGTGVGHEGPLPTKVDGGTEAALGTVVPRTEATSDDAGGKVVPRTDATSDGMGCGKVGPTNEASDGRGGSKAGPTDEAADGTGGGKVVPWTDTAVATGGGKVSPWTDAVSDGTGGGKVVPWTDTAADDTGDGKVTPRTDTALDGKGGGSYELPGTLAVLEYSGESDKVDAGGGKVIPRTVGAASYGTGGGKDNPRTEEAALDGLGVKLVLRTDAVLDGTGGGKVVPRTDAASDGTGGGKVVPWMKTASDGTDGGSYESKGTLAVVGYSEESNKMDGTGAGKVVLRTDAILDGTGGGKASPQTDTAADDTGGWRISTVTSSRRKTLRGRPNNRKIKTSKRQRILNLNPSRGVFSPRLLLAFIGMIMILGRGRFFVRTDTPLPGPFFVAAEAGVRVLDSEHSKGKDDEINIAASHTTIESSSDTLGINKLKKALSRNLRGDVGGDPAEVISELQDALKAQLDSVQSLLKIHHAGDNKALVSTIKSFVGEMNALVSSEELKGIAPSLDLDVPNEDLAVSINWEDVPDSYISQQFEQFIPDLLETVEQMKGLGDILEDVKPLLLRSSNSRHLKANLFSNEGGDDKPFKFDSRRGHVDGGQFIREGFTSRSFRQTERQTRPSMPNLSKFFRSKNDADATNRRLKVKEDHQRRLEALGDRCGPPCRLDDQNCRCKRLATCVNNMDHYDIALLFVDGYVETDPSNEDFATFTIDGIDLELFDADYDAYNKAEDILAVAQKIALSDTPDSEQCFDLLSQLHSACDPTSDDTCSEQNFRSFQDSVEEVCDKVHNPTKLLLSQISDKLDGYASDDGLNARATSCGKERVAFESCKNFAIEFEKLYAARDTTEYPLPNPMRWDPTTSVENGDTNAILFPTSFKFEQSPHGIASLAFPNILAIATSDDHVRVKNTNMCMDGGDVGGNIYMVNCQDENLNQDFRYDANTYQIKNGELCLDYNPGDKNVRIRGCNTGLNQKWRYDVSTQELKTFADNTMCLDWNSAAGGNNNLYMHSCTGGTSQQYTIPSSWLPDIGLNNLHQVRRSSNANMCMVGGNVGDSVYMADCQDGNPNQIFHYDASTHQIKNQELCIDYNPDQNVYMNVCTTGINQQWRYNFASKELRTFHDNMCLDWNEGDGSNLYMNSCTQADNQKFKIPSQWMPAISSTSPFSSVINHYDGTRRCMDSGRGEGQTVYMNGEPNCGINNPNQDFYYDANTRQIKNRAPNGKVLCLDYNFGDDGSTSKNVYMHECNDGTNQQWYYNVDSKRLQTLYGDNYCVDMAVDGSVPKVARWELYMTACNIGGENQQFLIPLLWLPSAYLNEVRVLSDPTKCMDAKPDAKSNIYMADCQVGNINQEFHFDTRTLQVKHRGLCLEHNTKNDNVFLYDCHDGDNQKWYYEGKDNLLKSFSGDRDNGNRCLDWNSGADNDQNNLYMNTCTSAKNQRFMIPSLWIPAITTKDPGYNSEELQGRTESQSFNYRPLPTGIWNGNWDEQKGHCSIEVLKDVIDTCDDTMSLLLGHATSLGTLGDIAEQVNNKGPEYMPGKCCLDNPLNSEWFGIRYNPELSYNGSHMECLNRGYWHLGLSEQACLKAGGQYYRSPCETLKECIDSRPKEGDAGYSESFESFAASIAIDDASDEEQCGNARTGLDFDADYPYDTEVCEEFNKKLCDEFYTEVDGLIFDSDFSKTTIVYDDPYNLPDLPFKPLPKHDGFQSPNGIGGDTQHLKDLGLSLTGVTIFAKVAGLGWSKTSAIVNCNKQPAAIVAAGQSVPNSFKVLCEEITKGWKLLSFVVNFLAQTALVVLGTTYRAQTLPAGDALDDHKYIESTFINLKTMDDWNYRALDTINENVNAQHTALRDQLEYVDVQNAEMICAALKGISGATACEWSTSGSRRLEEEDGGGDLTPELSIQWPEGHNLWDLIRQVNTKVVGVEKNVMAVLKAMDLEVDEGGPPPEKEKSKRTKAAKRDSARYLLEMEPENESQEAVLKRVEEKMSAMDGKFDELESKMGAVEGKVGALEGKVDALSNMIAQLLDQNKKLMEMKSEASEE